jgi:hypothetical protein
MIAAGQAGTQLAEAEEAYIQDAPSSRDKYARRSSQLARLEAEHASMSARLAYFRALHDRT